MVMVSSRSLWASPPCGIWRSRGWAPSPMTPRAGLGRQLGPSAQGLAGLVRQPREPSAPPLRWPRATTSGSYHEAATVTSECRVPDGAQVCATEGHACWRRAAVNNNYPRTRGSRSVARATHTPVWNPVSAPIKAWSSFCDVGRASARIAADWVGSDVAKCSARKRLGTPLPGRWIWPLPTPLA